MTIRGRRLRQLRRALQTLRDHPQDYGHTLARMASNSVAELERDC